MPKRKQTDHSFDPDYAVPPGATLQETIAALSMTQAQLALRTGMAAKTINEIIKGKAPITPGTAVLLERVTGVPARMWINLESQYREQLARIADRNRLDADLEWLRTIPTRELIKRGAIEDQPNKVLLLHAVLAFFGVANSQSWHKVWMQPSAAFRKSARFEANPGAVATWLRLGELEGHKIQTEPYCKSSFRSALVAIRSLTVEPPSVFEPTMVRSAAAAGVAVVFVPRIKKCPASGATRWLGSSKALIQLSLRYKSDDQFWFSFFHEAGHVLHDGKKEVFIDDDGTSEDDREQRADAFARTFLIPREHESVLPSLETATAVKRFAEQIGIAPGIVVGRLQNERLLRWDTPMNKLKRGLTWANA